MKVSKIAGQLICAALCVVCAAPLASAGLTLKLNPADLIKQGPGPLAADVGVLINWDGTGTNLLSGINFDVSLPANVTLPNPGPGEAIPNPMNFQFSSLLDRSLAFGGLDNVAALVAGDNLLTSLRFNVAAAEGDFPIGLTLVSAQQGSVVGMTFQDITSQFTTTGGTLRVTAVPEPTALALLGIVPLATLHRRRKLGFQPIVFGTTVAFPRSQAPAPPII